MPPPDYALKEVFSWEDFCSAQSATDWSHLPHEGSREFLNNLGLSAVYPACISKNFTSDAPLMGPLEIHDYHESMLDAIITFWHQASPALLAMSELWLRLFASLIAPIGIAYAFTYVLTAERRKKDKAKRLVKLSALLSVAASVVLVTDALYVFEWGANRGLSLLLASSALAVLVSWRLKCFKTVGVLVFLWVLTVQLVWDSATHELVFGGKGLPTNIPEGVYYDSENKLVSKAIQNWPIKKRTYSVDYGATPWLPTGDSLTGIPFLVNFCPDLQLEKVWVPTVDGEAVRLDISFPKSGHDPTKTVFLVLHGLNGGSQEEYVKDFAHRRNADGHTVVVMIARGLMETPIKGWDIFHGARTVDVHQAAKTLRRTLAPNQDLAVVGFSMGAIIVGNYVARYGSDCAVDAAVAVSGGLDMRIQIDFERAKRLWQPMLALGLREQFVVGKLGERYRQRLTKKQMLELMRATDISTVDEHAIVTYNNYESLKHYYADMSAMGDIPEDGDPEKSRIANVSIPFCVISSLDDPLITWRTVADNEGPRHPENLVKVGSGNLVLLLTKRGGHVGWPLGWNPAKNRWKWMNDASSSFVEAVVEAKRSTP